MSNEKTAKGRPTDDPEGQRSVLNVRLRPTVKDHLDSLSSVNGRSKTQVVEDGILSQKITPAYSSLIDLVDDTYDPNKAVNSPFRYAGGKFYARKLIAEHLTPHDKYIEVFAGGASVFFYKPKVEFNWLNDFDKDLVRVYEFIRDHPHDLIDWLAGREAKKELHDWYKNHYKPKSELGKAGRWYYLNRVSYSGIMKMQNMFGGMVKNFQCVRRIGQGILFEQVGNCRGQELQTLILKRLSTHRQMAHCYF